MLYIDIPLSARHRLKKTYVFQLLRVWLLLPTLYSTLKYAQLNFKQWQSLGAHVERGMRSYNGGLRTEPPVGSRGRAPSQGVRGKSPWSIRIFCICTTWGVGQFALKFVFSITENFVGSLGAVAPGRACPPLDSPVNSEYCNSAAGAS